MAPDTPTASPRPPLPRRIFNRHDSTPILLPHQARLSPGTQEPLKPRRLLQTLVKRVSIPSSSSPESVPEGQPTDSIGTTTTEVPSSSARSVSRHQSLSMMTLKALGWNTQNFYQSELQSANYDTVMKQFQLRKLPQEQAETSSEDPVNPAIMINGSLKPALESELPSPGLPGVKVPSRRFSSGISSGPPTRRQSGLRQPILPNSHVDHFHSVLIVVVFHTQVFLLPFQLAYGDVVPAGIVIAVEVLLLLEFLLTCNTAAEEKTSHRLVTSRRALFKQYARSWLVVDLFSSIPIQTIRMIIYRTSIAPNTLKLAARTFRIIVALRLGHLYLNIRKRFQRHEKEYEKGFLAWLWYSRYAHLLAIGKLL